LTGCQGSVVDVPVVVLDVQVAKPLGCAQGASVIASDGVQRSVLGSVLTHEANLMTPHSARPLIPSAAALGASRVRSAVSSVMGTEPAGGHQ
jgi:hypothetical protein